MVLARPDAGSPSTLDPRMPTPPIRTATQDPIAPETKPDRAAGVRGLARLLDSAVGIPGTNLRFGLDALIGLVPGIGDMAGAALSGYIVLTAARLGAPRPVLLRMVLNVATDTVIGSVPLLGDLFDAGWRSNTRNTALLDKHLESPVEAKRASVAVVAGVAALLVLLAIGAVALTVAVLRLVGSLF
jgi:hypothetical protein